MTKYCGRIFNAAEMTQIRQLIIDHPEYHRLALSQHVCRMLQWYKPDGGLKEMSCRVVMLRMHADGLIVLPPPLRFPRPSRGTKLTEATDPCGTVTGPVRHLGHLVLRKVEPQQSRLWNEYVERYHYLGYMPLPGAQLRYFAMLGKKIVALLGFGAAAWQAAPRDNFIGWTHDQRERNLHLIINNARFLILPWIQIPNLASMILGMAVKQVPRDWQERYAIKPVLMETFVETDRFAGTCYRAANWVHVGKTKGRGKLGAAGIQSVPIKDILLYPMDKDYKKILTAELG